MGTPLPPVAFEFEASPELPDDIRIYRFRMTEAISEAYTIIVEAATADVDFEFEKSLGLGVGVEVTRDDQVSPVYGVITAVDWLGVTNDLVQLRFTIRPGLAMLGMVVRSRIWQESSPLAIIQEVLEDGLQPYSRSVDVSAVTRGGTAREYCVQYRESDYDFAVRLMEEEGISYRFAHEADAEVLHLFEGSSDCPLLETEESSSFPIITHNPGIADGESIQAIEWRRRATATAGARYDYDWKAPTTALASVGDTADERGVSRRVDDHGDRRFFHDDLDQRQGDLQAALLLPGTRGFGRGNPTNFRAGARVVVDGHELEAVADELLLTRVRVDGYDASAAPAQAGGGDSGAAPSWTCYFDCVPAAAELRPRQRTPKPRVHGPQTARVSGPSGEEIHTDEFGRIKAKFHWDQEGQEDDTASCWIRVAQSWAGPSWGAQFIPRVGMEVVVEFLEGNPDRPLVVGCVYNGSHAPPFALPDNKTQSGVRTESSPGGDGNNELRFEDAAGSEEIYLHGQKDWTIAIENDKNQTIGNDESLEVTHDRKKHVKHDETITVDNDETITVGNDHTETIQHDMKLTVANDQTVTVGNNHSETIGGDRSETIGKGASEVVAQTKAITVGGAMQVTIGGALNHTVGGAIAEEVGGAVSRNVAKASTEIVGEAKTIKSGKDLVIEVGESGTVASAKNLAISAGEELTISTGKGFSVDVGSKGLIEAADELTLKCGKAQIQLKSSGDVTISGGKITVKGSGEVKVQGSKVANN